MHTEQEIQEMTYTTRRQLLRNFAVISGVIEAELAGEQRIEVELIKRYSVLDVPTTAVYSFNQHLYKVRDAKFVKSRPHSNKLNFYSSTAAGKKFYEENKALLSKIISEFTFSDLFGSPVSKSGKSKSLPAVPVSQSANRAVDAIGQIIDENRQMHGFLKRLHVEIGNYLARLDHKPSQPQNNNLDMFD